MALENVTKDNIKGILSDPELISQDPFSVVKYLCTLYNTERASSFVQELTLRALEHRDIFEDYESIINDLVRELGLFPYLEPDELSLSDRLAYYAHVAPR